MPTRKDRKAFGNHKQKMSWWKTQQMPTKDDRKEFETAIKNKDSSKIREFLQRDDAKELLLMKDDSGCLPIHDACRFSLDKASLQLILDAAAEYGIIKQILESKNSDGQTCLHYACGISFFTAPLSTDSFRLLLEYLAKHSDIKKMLEEKDDKGATCLHFACYNKLSTDSLRLLLEYLAKHADIKKVLEEKTNLGSTCLHFACCSISSPDSLRLLLEYLFKHADIRKMLEEKTNNGLTCLHIACCDNNISPDSLRLLLENLSKHSDIKKMLEFKTNEGRTCLDLASRYILSAGSLRLLLEYLTKHADIKKMLEEKNTDGWTCLHYACCNELSVDSLRLLLEYLSEYTDIKKMFEAKNNFGATCLHLGSGTLSTDSLRLLLEYLTKHSDIKKVLEKKKNNDDWTCLHHACVNYTSSRKRMSADSLRLLISFFPSNESFQLVLGSKDWMNKTALDLARNAVAYACERLLQDRSCWLQCRYWLFCNYQETFLNSLYPNSPEKTLEALKELNKNYDEDETLKKAIAQIEAKKNVSSMADATAPKTNSFSFSGMFKKFFSGGPQPPSSSTSMPTVQKADLQTQVMLLRDELDRQELAKLIFDRLPITGPNKEAISSLQENHVTKESFFLLNENHLKEMGVKVGPRVQLLQIIEQETFRRNNLSARSDLSSRPRSPGHTPRIIGGVPPIALSASALIQRHQQQQHVGNAPPLPHSSKDSNSERSFVATANSEVVSVNGGSESYNSGPTAKS